MNTMNGCDVNIINGAIPASQGQSGASEYVSIFKGFGTDNSNVSFVPCRVVLVWCFYDHTCRHNIYAAQRDA